MKIKSALKLEKTVNTLGIHSVDMLVWHILRKYLNLTLPRYYRRNPIRDGENSSKYTDKEVIISLTTFPKRIGKLWLVLESLYRQSVKPDRIILWLAEDQFPDKEQVNNLLKKYIEIGLDIRYCEDIKSHKKYFYTMKDFPEAIVVTVDDDILYSENMLEELLEKHKDNVNKIICHRAHLMKKDGDRLLPYNEWNYKAKGTAGPSMYLCPTGCSGILYPPNSLNEHVFDIDVLKRICIYSDDLWLKCMSYMNQTEVMLTGINNPEVFDIIGSSESGLAKANVLQGMNDKQVADVSNYFKIEW